MQSITSSPFIPHTDNVRGFVFDVATGLLREVTGMSVLRLGDTAPNFTAATTEGDIDFHSWKGGSWAVLFSHPADFTPVCTTELGRTATLQQEFEARDVKTIAVSVDPLESHLQWAR